jgi:hypothetical protein
MAFFGWFSKNKKDQVKVTKSKTNMLQAATTAMAFAEAGEHNTARSIISQAKQTRKILVIGDGESFSEKLSSYALDMARRLDFELVALNVTNMPFSLSGEKRDAAIAAFMEGAHRSGAVLQEKAAAGGIVFTHRVEIAPQDEVVEKLHSQDAGLRYVLTEPDPEVAKKQANHVAIPVFDLGSYQSMAA